MKDKGHEETEKLLKKLEAEINAEYAKAKKDLEAKINDYYRRFTIKDNLKRKALANGLITQDEYNQWRTGQLLIGERWVEMRDAIAKDLANANQIARSTALGHMPEVYAINHNYGTFQVEKGAKVDTSYTLYDRQTVEKLMMDDKGNFIPAPGKKVSARIAEGKDMAWNKKNVQSCMLQGILQGESIPNIATRLANTVGEQNRKAAIRNARTMTTGVQNAGRIASYERAESMGIKMKKQWVATLDMRTRHWHRELDGATAPVDEPFENEYGKIMYPGDPSADPGNIYNCRCTLIAALEGFERDISDLGLRHDDHLGDMTYEEWKEDHESRSEPITRQDDISESMQGAYGSEYRSIADLDLGDANLDKRNAGETVASLTAKAREGAEENGIEYLEPEKYETQPTREEIIDFVKKEDMTEGSCTSAAFAYIGNEGGYRVKDFRGGTSCDYFADTETIAKIAILPGVDSKVESSNNEEKLAWKMVKSIKRNKEYVLSAGMHTAVIRRTKGGYEYLELQNKENFGWNKLSKYDLEERFGCRRDVRLLGVPKKSAVILIDADTLRGNEHFNDLLGFINSP